MNHNFDAFLIFYNSWHEYEITLKEMRDMVVDEIGEAGLIQALKVLTQKRLERESNGIRKTFYSINL